MAAGAGFVLTIRSGSASAAGSRLCGPSTRRPARWFAKLKGALGFRKPSLDGGFVGALERVSKRLGANRALRVGIFALKPCDEFGHRGDLLDRADALAASPDIPPGLGF